MVDLKLVPIVARSRIRLSICTITGQERGKEITIRFKDVQGVQPNDTQVMIHGVGVGTVALRDGDDIDFGKAALRRAAASFKPPELAREEHAKFFHRPARSIHRRFELHQPAFIRGPVIEAIPGDGPQATEFDGLDKRPVMQGEGVRIILYGKRVTRLAVDAPVYYRGIQVGAVQDIRFSSDSTLVNMTVFIWQQFVPPGAC